MQGGQKLIYLYLLEELFQEDLYLLVHSYIYVDKTNKNLKKASPSITKYKYVCSTVVERATYMRVYAGSSPTSADHRKELI